MPTDMLHYCVKHVKLKTLQTLYKSSKSWLAFDLEYADTATSFGLHYNDSLLYNPNQVSWERNFRKYDRHLAPKTVLCLHSAAGNYQQFTNQLYYLQHATPNLRVLAPNLPDYQLTIKTRGAYRHSTHEKAHIVSDFLTAINVHRVDCLVCHSMASLIAVKLLNDHSNRIRINSVMFVNPYTFDCYVNRYLLTAVYKPFVRLFNRNLLRPLVEPFGHKLLPKLLNFRFQSVASGLELIESVRHSDKEEFECGLSNLIKMQLPTHVVIGNKDKWTRYADYEQFATMLGATSANYEFVNNANSGVIKSRSAIDFPLVTVACDGGYNSVFKNVNLINERVIKLLYTI